MLLCASAFVSLAACSGGGASVQETGELGWPEITSQTKPWSRWWWPASAVGKADIDTMLTRYSEAGLGGLEVTTIYGAKGYEEQYLDYLSPEWMELFTYTLDEAAGKGLGIDLANASGWPFGGPWVTPDYACRYLATRTWELEGGEKFAGKIEYVEKPMVRSLGKKADISELEYPVAANDSLQQYAFEQVRYPLSLPLIAVAAYGADGEYEDLTSLVGEDGKLDWTAPEGDWTVCAMFLGWHGKMVERAGPGGEGDVIDHFSGDAITRYLAKFDEAFKGYDVSGIRYYFNDSYEVDDAVGDSDWTEDFFNEFQTRRGYDLKPYMLDLLGRGDDKDVASRVLFDYRTTIGELLLEKYSMMWQEWAAKQGKGIRNQAHGSPANILDLYSVSDVPETEGRSIIGMKTASSASHVCDKPLTSSESATWLNEHFRSNLGDVKTAMDTYLLSGVNHTFYHGTCMSPNDAPWPGWLFYAAVHFQPNNSFWTDFAAFNKYVARCQSFLQAGKPDNDILLFFDATDLLSEPARNSLLFHMNQNTPAQSARGESASYLYDKGYTWDYITDRMLADRVSVKDGKIVTKGGTAYSAVIIPECEMMLVETFERLVELARAEHYRLVLYVAEFLLVFEVHYRDFPFENFVSLYAVYAGARPVPVVGAGVNVFVLFYEVAHDFRVVVVVGLVVGGVVVQRHFDAVLFAAFLPLVEHIGGGFGENDRNAYILRKPARLGNVRLLRRIVHPEADRNAAVVGENFFEVVALLPVHLRADALDVRIFLAERLARRKAYALYPRVFEQREGLFQSHFVESVHLNPDLARLGGPGESGIRIMRAAAERRGAN